MDKPNRDNVEVAGDGSNMKNALPSHQEDVYSCTITINWYSRSVHKQWQCKPVCTSKNTKEGVPFRQEVNIVTYLGPHSLLFYVMHN